MSGTMSTDQDSTSSDSSTQQDDVAKVQEKADNGWKEIFTVDRTMVKYKLFYLFFIGGGGSIITFLPLQMKQLGLSPSRIGLASSVRPFCGALSTAIIGVASDKVGYRRIWLTGLLLVMLGCGIGLGVLRSPEQAPCDGGNWINSSLARTLDDNVDSNYRNVQLQHRREVRTTAPVGMEGSKPPGNDSERLEHLLEDRSWQYDHIDLLHVFVEILIIGSLFEMSMSPVFAIADASIMVALKADGKETSEYGGTRGWGNTAWDLSGFLTGVLLQISRYDIVHCGVPLTNATYIIILIPFGLLMIGALINATQLRLSNSDYDESVIQWKHLKILLAPHYFIIFTAILFFGIYNGAVWGFLFWHLENLGATHGLLSVVTLFQAASEIPAGYVSSLTIKYLGYWNSLNLGFMTYSLRFLFIFITKNPWWIVPVEILNGFAFCQTWNVLISYMGNAVPPNLFVTVCGFCSALYFGIGVALGYLITGYLVEEIGAADTFGYYALASFILSIVFAVLIRIVMAPSVTFQDKSSDTDKTEQVTLPMPIKRAKDAEKKTLLDKD